MNASPIAVLRQDQVRIEKILAGIERALDPVDLGALGRWLDLLDLVWNGYRRREVLMFEALAALTDRMKVAAGTASREHEFESGCLESARGPLRNSGGDTVLRVDLDRNCRSLCGSLREHFQRRVRVLFPEAESLFAGSRWRPDDPWPDAARGY